MPRDSNGNYTLPAGNPVIPGTIITAEWANDTMADMGNEITNSLSREGQGGMLTQLLFLAGGPSSPGMSWDSQPNTGFYLFQDGMRVSNQGIDRMRWTDDSVDVFNIVTGLFEPILTGNIDAIGVNYNNANQNIILAEQVQGALDELSLAIEGIISGITIKGTWNAATNEPPIDDNPEDPKEGGDLWIVSVAGNSGLPPAGGGDDLINWQVGERPVYVASAEIPGWVRLAPVTGIIASTVLFNSIVFEAELPNEIPPSQVQAALDFSWQYIANIIGGVDALNVQFTPTAGILSDNVQQAIVEVRTDAPQLSEINNYSARNIFEVLITSQLTPLDPLDVPNKAYVDVLEDRVFDNEQDIEQLQGAIGDITADAVDFVDIDPQVYGNVQTGLTAALDGLGTRFDNTGLVPEDNVSDAINFIADFVAGVVGGLEFRGDWDANDGLEPDDGETPAVGGNFWIVSVAGTTPLPEFPDGLPNVIDSWDIGDRAIYLDNTNGTGYIKLIAATSLPASSVTFNSFNFDNAFPALPSPDDVQEALDVIWAPLARVVDGGIIISPITLLLEDLNTFGTPTDAGWYFQIDGASATIGRNYPPGDNSGMLQIVRTSNAGVVQVYYASGGTEEGATIFYRVTVNNGVAWSNWDTGLDQSALDDHAALVAPSAPADIYHLDGDEQDILGIKTFLSQPHSAALQDTVNNTALVTLGYMNILLDVKMDKSGGVFTGVVSGVTPVSPADLTTKAYVDGLGSAVDSVFGRFGDVIALTGDYSAFYLSLSGGALTNTLTIGPRATYDTPNAVGNQNIGLSGVRVESTVGGSGQAFWVAQLLNETQDIASGIQSVGSANACRMVAGGTSAGSTGGFISVNNSGNASCNGDFTAFLGQLAASQPFIDATGLTTSFTLIEHLLDIVEGLEARIEALENP